MFLLRKNTEEGNLQISKAICLDTLDKYSIDIK
jgi:hypothetical protein